MLFCLKLVEGAHQLRLYSAAQGSERNSPRTSPAFPLSSLSVPTHCFGGLSRRPVKMRALRHSFQDLTMASLETCVSFVRFLSASASTLRCVFERKKVEGDWRCSQATMDCVEALSTGCCCDVLFTYGSAHRAHAGRIS